MTISMQITLAIIAVASIALNIIQGMGNWMERKQQTQLIKDAALLEEKHLKLEETYKNEKLHREWAIGRIQDQQAVIDQLRGNLAQKKPKKGRKEARR